MAQDNLAIRAKAELELRRRRNAAAAQPQAPSGGAGNALARGFSSSVVDNLLGVPNYVANTVKEDVSGLVSGLNPFKELPDPNAEGTYPSMADSPRFGANQVFGMAQRGGEAVGALTTGDYSQFLEGSASENQVRENMQAAEANPNAYMMGDVGGDVAFLASGRGMRPKVGAGGAPVSSWGFGARGWSQGQVDVANRVTTYLGQASRRPGAIKSLNTAVEKVIASHLPRGLARAAETGAEGAVLAVLDGNDPTEVAALNAGLQAGGSLAISGAKNLFTTGGLASSVLVGAIAINYMNNLPGGGEGTVDAIGTAMSKTIPYVAMGLVAAVAGYSRVPSVAGGTDIISKVANQTLNVPRSAITSLIQETFDEREKGENNVALVIGKYSQNPDHFGAVAARRLERAIMSEDVKISEAIDSLMDNKEFKERFNEL